jgi:splicing factor U2AF subunit
VYVQPGAPITLQLERLGINPAAAAAVAAQGAGAMGGAGMGMGMGMPMARAPPAGAMVLPGGLVNAHIPDSPNKVFIGGVPRAVSEVQLVELLTSFGPLKAFYMPRDPVTGQAKGFAFCEWADPSITDMACAQLSTIPLGSTPLTVRHANPATGGPAARMQAAAPVYAGYPAAGLPPAAAPPSNGYGMAPPAAYAQPLPVQPAPPQAAPPAGAVAAIGGGPPTRVLRMRNMLTPGELADLAELADIRNDISSELQRYGRLLSIKIQRSPPEPGSVLAEFSAPSEAAATAAALQGRLFNGMMVACDYMDQHDYAAWLAGPGATAF